jgi:isoamylase
MTNRRAWPGRPYPLGAIWDGQGTNFALYSEHATVVQLLLFADQEAQGAQEVIDLRERHGFIWHAYLPGIAPGQLYAYRLDGPFEPEAGHRFNPAKVLLDPYARAIAGTIVWDDVLFGYPMGAEQEDLARDERDSSPFLPRAVVTSPYFDWEGDRLPGTPWSRTIIYEVHVKGFTMQHPELDPTVRGTYAGLGSPKVIEYLKELGVTAVELMPVQQHVDDRYLVDQGLTNYWGYNTIGFFAPDCRYASSGVRGEQVAEFKGMVKALHRAGIEVILDVVYNHTAEGNQLGPTLSFRGIDNAAYYLLSPEDPRYYMDFSGCGNSFNMSNPQVTQLIMDSLRYWVSEMHVDGFRFDLAAALARELQEVDHLSAFFDIIQQDPVISQVKLIAEPWDLGEDGYQVGKFPPLWAEWNGRYRDAIRGFWRGDEAQVGELGYRLSGSSDLYQNTGRKPYASINFVTAHDGFTLHDLVSYNEKHNEANLEGNQDGESHNLSWNCGMEGPTDDAAILALRQRQMRNFLATLLFSQGVPMLLAGDEVARSQQGNNNVYCQDNELAWFDWEWDESQRRLLACARRLIRLRTEHPVFRRRNFFQGRKVHGSEIKDISWFKPDATEMTDADWSQSFLRAVGLRLAGDAILETNDFGERILDDTFLLLCNAHHEPIPFQLPKAKHPWELLLTTANPDLADQLPLPPLPYLVEGRSLSVLRTPSREEDTEEAKGK